jgi:hypothetical protein
MTMEEALADIEGRSRSGLAGATVTQKVISCRDIRQAVRLLAEAYEHLRKRDPLYANRRRSVSLAPPPASVPPD